ncbi:hypothetical protein FDH01_gp124 [Acinetobacter phage vB_AbaM_ME3]|uniref:Uncharacterized protein n=1 Tax=Acinetobacter phage vB_AbaM_ME3 TaxID=1837876 RepID=A0A172Q0B7_9CAUD|nr:hypothetical protein FDH01_gp124 [Acinetobacter phage vB_AbaM_ME3]AND75285.1 hypothetical protein ME3_124 [Acinetobacter phage vB_AbaM_ME3]
MHLLNPFNGELTPLYEVHITIEEYPLGLALLKESSFFDKLGVKLTPIKFFNISTPSQYMVTYIDKSEDVSDKMLRVCAALASVGLKVIRKKIETTWKWYEANLDSMKLQYLETHIELPIECFNVMKARGCFLKSYNGSKPHLFSLTNRTYTHKYIMPYFSWLESSLRTLHRECLSIPEYQLFYPENKTNIEVCILDTNPELDNIWFTNLE